jgi:hypothetical protein
LSTQGRSSRTGSRRFAPATIAKAVRQYREGATRNDVSSERLTPQNATRVRNLRDGGLLPLSPEDKLVPSPRVAPTTTNPSSGPGAVDRCVAAQRRATPRRESGDQSRARTHLTPQTLRKSVCSLAGRRGVDLVEAPQMTGHSPAVWAKFYARSFGKAQRDEARARMLEHGFGAVDEQPVEP